MPSWEEMRMVGESLLCLRSGGRKRGAELQEL